MSDSVDILKKLALQVRNASVEGENTAERIGRIFIGILENMDNSDIEKLTKYFLRKDKEDTANELITFLKGFLVGKNGSGITVLEDGTSQAVVDRLYVKIKAVFDELEVKKKTHVGGEQIISPAGMKCVRVEELDESYHCFFLSEVDGVTINNEFTVGTLALAQEFNIKEGTSHNVSNRYYWREVTGVGTDYIDLNKTNADKDSDIPVAGDDIIGLGHLTDITRQAAIILSSVNETSPSITFYQGINTFSLVGKEVIGLGFDKSTGHAYINVYGDAYIGAKDESTYIRYTQKGGVDIKGMFHIEQGSTGWRNMEGLPDEIQAAADLAQKAQDAIDNAAVGSVNLLRNSGFTGDYETEDLSAATELSADTELFSKQLEYWTGVATVSADSDAGSGYSAAIGSLSQSVSLIKGESYVISYKAKGTSVSVSCGSFSVSQPLTSSYQRYTHKITFNGSGIFLISGTATVCDLQLERGTIATDWKPSILDNDKATAGFQSINYIASAIKDGSVDILGGLILANMIQLGNYKDGKMQKVTAGVSGIYNDDDDVAFWAGGTLQQAILTVMRFRNDPNYQPTDEEWANMANFVATHGGDTFLRGYIYALGGKFRGVVEALGGFFRGKVETSVDGKRIVIDPDKNTLEMYTTEGHATLILRFDTSSDGWEYGDLILRKYAGDQLILETTVYPERIRIQNHVENTDIILNPNNVSFYGSKGETLLVGMKPVYNGVGVYKHVANIDCSNWPGKDDVSSGQVYVELEQIQRFEKIVEQKVVNVKNSMQIIDNSRKILFLTAPEIHWHANVWYMERFHLSEDRLNPSNPVQRLSFIEVTNKKNRELLQEYAKYHVGIGGLTIANIRGQLYEVKRLLEYFKEEESICQVDENQLDDYFRKLEEKDTKDDTFNKRIVHYIKFYQFLNVRGYMKEIPF